MAILEDGEKWACDACVKGHRVSSCQHRDRPLQHINRKGRPVSQCTHCRGLRKHRSAHVKCVCAEHGINKDGSMDRTHGGKCSCMHGFPCTCALRTESLDPANLSKIATHNNLTHRRAHSYGKPVMPSRRSDSLVPNVHGGQHPQLHRLNNAAHEYGMPYTIKKFSRSTGNFDLPQQSAGSFTPTANANAGSSPLSKQHNSPDSFILTPRQDGLATPDNNSPAISFSPSPGTASQNGQNAFPARTQDPNFITAPTPHHGHFARHSINDFSQFSWGNLNVNQVTEPPMASSVSENFPAEWHDYKVEDCSMYNNTFTEAPAQRSSVVSSVDHPGLSHSPSASASDTGESTINYGDGYSSNMLRPPMTIDPHWTMKELSESPATDYTSPSYSAVPNPYIYGVNEVVTPGFDDFMGGPGPETVPSDDKSNPPSSAQFPPTPYIQEPDDTRIVVPEFVNYQSPEEWSGVQQASFQSGGDFNQHAGHFGGN